MCVTLYCTSWVTAHAVPCEVTSQQVLLTEVVITNRSFHSVKQKQCRNDMTDYFRAVRGQKHGYVLQPEKHLLVLYYEMTRSCNRWRGNAQIIDLRVWNGCIKPTITISQMMRKAMLQASSFRHTVTFPSSPSLPLPTSSRHMTL
jgi:hypothetical protein